MSCLSNCPFSLLSSHLQLDPGGHDDGPEAERVWADRRDHDGGDGRVDHGGAGGHGVGRRSGGRADDEAVALDGRDEFAVEIEVDVGEVGRRAAVDHHLITDLYEKQQ